MTMFVGYGGVVEGIVAAKYETDDVEVIMFDQDLTFVFYANTLHTHSHDWGVINTLDIQSAHLGNEAKYMLLAWLEETPYIFEISGWLTASRID